MIYEQLFKQLLFPVYEGSIKGRSTSRYLREYERLQWQGRAELEGVQLVRLNALLAHCWKNVPFLKSYWSDHGLDSAPISHSSELAKYPTIDKQLISRNFSEMRARNFTGEVLSKTTGGSTGDPFRFEYSQENYAHRIAVMWRGYRWCGAELGRRTAYVWGTGVPQPGLDGLKERLYHLAFNRLILDAFRMTEDNLQQYVAALDDFKPKVVVGYVAPLVLLAGYMRNQGHRPKAPIAVISGAESLTDPDRETIETGFGAPVFNTYGCREFMLIASECEKRNGLHVNVDHLVVETVDAAGNAVSGKQGDVCVTDLHNYAMPFVRYRNGDMATLSDRTCECGRGLALMESVDGRVLDLIVTPDGRAMPGEFFVYVMLDFPNVAGYQVVQTATNEIEVRIVPRAGFQPDDRKMLESKISSYAGPAMKISILEVDSIPRTASGKRRVTISKIR